MICPRQLSTDLEYWWGRNYGRAHGPLGASWEGRDGRDLFAYMTTACHVMARAQLADVEVELIEDNRWPVMLVVHLGSDYRAYDVELVGSRFVRLRSEDGGVAASVALSRQKPPIIAALAQVVSAAVEQMHATAKASELVC